MTKQQATEIAALINRRNQLVNEYTADDILAASANYEFELRGEIVAACVERKRVQWYQWEICHLSVHEDWEGQGLGFKVYERAEKTARTGGARLLQCTIREGNKESVQFFDRQGFTKVGRFVYSRTGNTVGIWQKVLSVPPTDSA